MADERYVVTTEELAEILGLSVRRIQQLADEQKIPRLLEADTQNPIRGKWYLPSVIRDYLQFKLSSVKSEDPIEQEIQKERLRKLRLDADIREMDRDFREGNLHRSEDVAAVMNAMHSSIRTRALSLPLSLARELIGQEDIIRIQAILERGIYEFLSESKTFDEAEFHRLQPTVHCGHCCARTGGTGKLTVPPVNYP
jgi:phage terminase Nu1 subunit (DNA packaging protein)